jgi:putative DNA primase/helicase
MLPAGVAVPIPSRFETKSLGQDFTTLCALLDDASYRETIFNSRGELTFNEMTTEVRWGERDLVSADLSTIRHGLERIPASSNGKPLKFEVNDIAQALGLVARRRTVHPVREWLSSLKWDGKPRLEAELPTILGHEAHGFEARLLRRWLVSAVARAMEPGCKADNVLILLGKQRAKKSTFFDRLGGPWFTDSDVKPGDKDGQLKMRKKWIIEWGELDDIKSSRSMELVKKFLSQRTDFFRSPYGKDTIERDRHCVFAGTSNEDEIFSDPTGNFRFWPIQLRLTGPRIDAAFLEDNREQLFAEACALFEGGRACPECKAARERCGEHRWWLTDEEDAELGRRNKRFEIIDAWQSNVLQYLDENRLVDVVRIGWILGSMKLTADQLHGGAQQRVGKILRHLDWVPDKQRTEHGGWENVWRRPEVKS